MEASLNLETLDSSCLTLLTSAQSLESSSSEKDSLESLTSRRSCSSSSPVQDPTCSPRPLPSLAEGRS